MFKFQLFIAGNTPNSAQALRNITAICSDYLPDGHELEVVDVFVNPTRALDELIFMTPTLLKLGPFPVTRIVGTMNNTDLVVEALGLPRNGH